MYNILIVDDEKIERSGIRMLLKRMGIELGVFEACNGKQALEYLTSDKNTGIGHIDILLTDVKMPFMDGIELIKNVMHNDISLKTIIFSGYNEFEYAKLAVKLGVKDYILKPVDPSEFSSTITGVITELDEEHKKDEDYNRQANFIKQYYISTLILTRYSQLSYFLINHSQQMVILIRTLKKCLQIFMTIYTERRDSLCILLCPVYSTIIMSFHR